MTRREIPASEWRDFLEQFSRDHRAWLATVERLAEAASHREVVDRPLRSLVPEISGGKITGIAVQFLQDSTGRIAVRVDAPAKLRVGDAGSETADVLEIEDEAGDQTRIHFRAAPPRESLDGVAPGEI